MGPVEISLKWLLFTAMVLPLASFFLILVTGRWLGKLGGVIATGAILIACVLSFTSLVIWIPSQWDYLKAVSEHHDAHGHDAHDEHEHSPSETDRDKEHAEPKEGEKHASALVPAINASTGIPISLTALAEEPPHDNGDTSKASDVSEKPHGEEHEEHAKPAFAGDYYLLGQFGDLRITISYYIDTLTVAMFCMVTLIATCIHFYATGYMHEELHEPVTDHEVSTPDGKHLERPGRYPRFFQYMSLFCFSMLGLVLAGNIAMVFVFWELVGICSYFLIGFYIERRSAQVAANKAFIVNRVGDFGMIIGLMALWAGLGTFAFGDVPLTDPETGAVVKDEDGHVVREAGIFSLVRPGADQHPNGPEHAGELIVPDGMVQLAASDRIAAIVRDHATLYDDREAAHIASQSQIRAETNEWRKQGYGYWLLVVAGVGIFCGCVGKSAQFPLHTWLPDAMEGPTPVSALVHSATMVAAGVYLVGRFYPVFAPEVLLVIAIVGCITLFMAATIAITATDIKRVLAYSTVSQLGYMMMALGVGGWAAGMMHLITHAFFKSLLFLCSGAVIHAVHTNEMPQMGGLLKKMPVTAITMLIGCLAIAGASIPFVVGMSGYYSKDAILEQALSFGQSNAFIAGFFFAAAAGGAAITAFYMFRLWFMTFTGKPRDEHRYDHAHESPPSMYVPLIVLATFAITVAWVPMRDYIPESLIGGTICAVVAAFFVLRYNPFTPAHDDHDHHPPVPRKLILVPLVISGIIIFVSVVWLASPLSKVVVLSNLLESARPVPLSDVTGLGGKLTWPNEFASHAWAIRFPATMLAFGTAIAGIALAAAFYWLRKLDPAEAARQFRPIHKFLINKWWFDELYDFLFVRPAHVIARIGAGIDRNLIDWFIDNTARATTWFANLWDNVADRTIVDGFFNRVADVAYAVGLSLRRVQVGQLRQYVMFIVLGTIIIFLLISFFWNPTLAG